MHCELCRFHGINIPFAKEAIQEHNNSSGHKEALKKESSRLAMIKATSNAIYCQQSPTIEEELWNELNETTNIGIMVDESTDISTQSHIILYVKYCLKVLSKSNGASVMLGRNNGVAIKLTNKNPYLLLNEEKSDSDLLNQVKSKGGSKLRSWIYNWGERKNHPTDSKTFIFECNQKLDSGDICTAKIETTGSTGNIISHLARKHKIYEHSKPLTTTSSLKQIKIDHYTIPSDSPLQMTQDRQKYLENLLFEWLVLDFQPLYLLKSPSFPYEFSEKQLKQYIRDNAKITLAIQYMQYPHTGDAIQEVLEKVIYEWELQDKRLPCTAHTIQLVVGKGLLTAEVLIARAKRLINFFTSPKQNERLLDAQKKNSEEMPEEETWERLIILKPYIDIVISSLNASKDRNVKEDAKRLQKINLTNDEWDALEKYYEVIETEALIAALLDPRKKKMKFANNDQMELAKTSLHEVYNLTKNNINIQQESHGPKPKKRKISQARVYKKTLFSDDEFNDTQIEDNEIESKKNKYEGRFV
ncbi:hypothetical protein C1645_834452 [Glomus cerebriforme]|uniref:BED-type domain-containing protein n=1 Tax=Glomus cerebriforme TaxID=658196 RepID=A0A397SAL5_9GLOM|nr:hypothetical protein C1645_834452 [Glomus cerebriforme]